MINDLIREQIDAGEGGATAFVESAANVAAIAEHVCGFLNTRGGVIFIGISTDKTRLGVGSDPEHVREQLEVQLQSAISPKALFTLSVDGDGHNSIITVEAPAGRDIPYVTDGRVFWREGKRTLPATPEQLRQMVQNRSVEADRWERRVSLELSEEALDTTEVFEMVDEARLSQRYAFPQGREMLPVLRELNLIGRGGLTNACDVLFAHRPTVRHPQCRVRYVHFESDKAGSSYKDDVWVEGPLAVIYRRLMERLSNQVQIRAQFGRDEHGRQDSANYSIEAIREGLVNALVHRDYSAFSGGATVSVYPDRIEIWNSGRLPHGIKVGDLRKSHPSIPVNPDIAHVLYLRRLMERVGRGTQKIIAACEELGAKPPKWQDADTGVTLTVYSADAKGVAPLNIRQATLIAKLRPGDSLRLADFISEQSISERQGRRDLAELEAAGFLRRIGQARATFFQRTEKTV